MKSLFKSKSILNIQHNTKDEVDLKLPIKLTATVKRLNCTAWSKRWLWNESKNHFFKCVKCHIIYPILKLFMLNKYNVETKFHKQQIVTKELKLFFFVIIWIYNRFKKYWASWIEFWECYAHLQNNQNTSQREGGKKQILLKNIFMTQNHWIKWLSKKGANPTVISSHIQYEAKIYMKEVLLDVWAFRGKKCTQWSREPVMLCNSLPIVQEWWLQKGLRKERKNWNKYRSSNETAQ